VLFNREGTRHGQTQDAAVGTRPDEAVAAIKTDKARAGRNGAEWSPSSLNSDGCPAKNPQGGPAVI